MTGSQSRTRKNVGWLDVAVDKPKLLESLQVGQHPKDHSPHVTGLHRPNACWAGHVPCMET